MATQKALIKDEDPLGKLIISSNNAPLPWGQQQKMVELFMQYIEEQNLKHNGNTEGLLQLIKFQQEQNNLLVKKLKC